VIDYYLRFTNEETAQPILDILTGCAIDIIGQTDSGYLVNVRATEPIESLEQFNTTPLTPLRVWA
jgi:hypothetical protein